ncbi:MAG TPA: HEAT repeat domain-containing protein, partial [Puia sp.]|nr:HEAT repeat domain-containing protein [Puia sp.]
LTRFLHEELSGEEREQVEAHLTECAECRREWESLRRIWGMLDEVPVPEPAAGAQLRFDAMLDGYKESLGQSAGMSAGASAGMEGRGSLIGMEGRGGGSLWALLRRLFAGHPAFALGYSLLMVVAGLGGGYLLYRSPSQTAEPGDKKELVALTAQVAEMREMMMKTLLQNPSASERMRGVSYTSEIQAVNKDVIEALLSTLNNDPNTNVRLMTLEALTHYANNPLVREGLVQSILQQESPLVQAALADVMLRLQEKRAIRPLKKLLQHKDLNEMVRTRIEETISRLS